MKQQMQNTCAPGQKPTVAKVLLDTRLPQLDHLFDYAIPEDLQAQIQLGQRVKVPIRSQRRQNFGWVIGLQAQSEYTGKLVPLSGLIGEIAQLTPDIWQLARAASDRAAGSASDILRLAIPSRHVRAEKKHLELGLQATTVSAEAASGVDPTNQHHYDVVGKDLARALDPDARIAFEASHGVARLTTGAWVPGWAPILARVALEQLAAGKSTIFCVPDYRDQNFLEEALADAGVTDPVRADARQSNEQRYRQFLRALDATPRVIVGNRSAVYAPAHELGAIVVWDDGDPLMHEPLAPYVTCRDAALLRQQQSGCALLFAAYTRSLAVERLVADGYIAGHQGQPRRTKIRHADMHVNPDPFAGRTPEAALRLIRDTAKTGPVLVQVAKPGHALAAYCKNCRQRAKCAHCAGPLAPPKTGGKLQCLWCLEPTNAWRCDNCAGNVVQLAGAGSELTAQQFATQFAGARVIVSDGANPVEKVDARGAIVIATPGAEPVAAGGYKAVVLLDVHRLIAMPTLNVGEHCLRVWENAAAKAAPDGLCMVATGGGPVVQAFITGQQAQWRQQELAERKELRYPPTVRVASMSGAREAVAAALEQLADVKECESLGIAPIGDGTWRAIVRSSLRAGPTVATTLRAAIVEQAAGTAPSRARPRQGQRANLRVRMDDPTVFDAPAMGE